MNSDCIVIWGSNMAECHPVAFQWVMEAKERGAKVIHVDPAVHPDQRAGRTARADPGGRRHRVPRRADQLRAVRRAVVPRVCRRLHQRGRPADRGLRRRRGPDGLFSGYDPKTQDDYDNWRTGGTPTAGARPGHADGEPATSAVRPAARRTARAAPTLTRPGPGRDPAASALRLPGTEAALRPLHAGAGRASAGSPGRLVARVSGRARRPPAWVLRGRLDPALDRRAAHQDRVNLADAARQHGPARRRHPGVARPREHPGLDRRADAVSPACRVPADADGRRIT